MTLSRSCGIGVLSKMGENLKGIMLNDSLPQLRDRSAVQNAGGMRPMGIMGIMGIMGSEKMISSEGVQNIRQGCPKYPSP